jgi:hemerythrin-like metal-binding protein
VTQTSTRTLPANFEIGIAELDAQHKRLHGLLERLRDAVGKHYGYATTAILDELTIETRIHFAVEESLMRMLSFPDVEAHVTEHQILRRIAVIPGDGIGREVVPEGLRVLRPPPAASASRWHFDHFDWSCDYYERTAA